MKGSRYTEGAVSVWGLLGLGAPDGTEWMRHGLCAQTDPEVFFPDKGESARPPKSVCAVCPVRSECLEYALERNERFGVWGGLSERERRRVRAQRTAVTGAGSDRLVA